MRTTCRLLVIVLASIGLGFTGCEPDAAPSPPVDEIVEPAGHGAEAQSGRAASGRRPLRGPWWRDAEIVAELDLSDDQLGRVKELMTGDTGKRTTDRRRERRAGLSFLRALSQDPYDPAAVDHHAAEVVEVLSDILERRVEMVRSLRDILTHEQWLALWKLAPEAVQVTRFVAVPGPAITVTDEEADAPGDTAAQERSGDDAARAP